MGKTNNLRTVSKVITSSVIGIVIAVIVIGVASIRESNVAEDYHPTPVSNPAIVISNPIDVIDSGVTFNPPFARVLIGVNNTVTWKNQNGTSVTLQAPYEGYLFKNATMAPGESFSFTFNRTGVFHVYEVAAGKFSTIVVSTKDLESSRLHLAEPSILQDDSKDLQSLARTVIKAVDKEDDIATTRLNNTQIVAYTTEKEADIIIYRVLCTLCSDWEYQPVLYRSPLGKPIAYSGGVNDFAEAIMQEIGYTLDGSEWIDTAGVGESGITISQQVNGGWILPTPGVRVSLFNEWTWIEVGRWYDNESISNFTFVLSSEEARKIAIDFMNNQVFTNAELAKYKYEFVISQEARVIVLDDKVMYIVPTGYRTTDPIYYDDVGHCGGPAAGNFDVLVDAATGKPFDWQYSTCF
jgi:hypothetical protein